jgi:hypothetical protein
MRCCVCVCCVCVCACVRACARVCSYQSRLKSAFRITEKTLLKYGGDVSKVLDAVRTLVVAPSMACLKAFHDVRASVRACVRALLCCVMYCVFGCACVRVMRPCVSSCRSCACVDCVRRMQ